MDIISGIFSWIKEKSCAVAQIIGQAVTGVFNWVCSAFTATVNFFKKCVKTALSFVSFIGTAFINSIKNLYQRIKGQPDVIVNPKEEEKMFDEILTDRKEGEKAVINNKSYKIDTDVDNKVEEILDKADIYDNDEKSANIKFNNRICSNNFYKFLREAVIYSKEKAEFNDNFNIDEESVGICTIDYTPQLTLFDFTFGGDDKFWKFICLFLLILQEGGTIVDIPNLKSNFDEQYNKSVSKKKKNHNFDFEIENIKVPEKL